MGNERVSILTPGLHYGIPMLQYIGDPAPEPSLSKGTILDLYHRSPAHAWYNHPRLNPSAPREESTRADIGTAVHSAILGGNDVAFAPEEFSDWRKKGAQEFRDVMRAEGKTPLLAHQRPAVESAATAAIEFLKAVGLWEEGRKTEGTCIWQDGATYKRCRFDLWLPEANTSVDIKTCDSAEPGAWCRSSMLAGGYDIQQEHILSGIRAVGLADDPEFNFVLVEIEPPYCCSLVRLSPESSALARGKIKIATELWSECMKSGRWPGYPAVPYEAEMKPWQEVELREREYVAERRKAVPRDGMQKIQEMMIN